MLDGTINDRVEGLSLQHAIDKYVKHLVKLISFSSNNDQDFYGVVSLLLKVLLCDKLLVNKFDVIDIDVLLTQIELIF
jgi:hypothetical protein